MSRQCPSCGGDCRGKTCERANVKPDIVAELREGATWDKAERPTLETIRKANAYLECLCCDAADEIERLRQICRNVYEVWAGSEGIPEPRTASEAYLLQLVLQMRDEVKVALAATDPLRDLTETHKELERSAHMQNCSENV